MKRQEVAIMILTLIGLFLLPLTTTISRAAEGPPAKGEIRRAVATMDDKGVQHIDVVGGEYYYDPNYIVVKVNKPVELRVKKAGGFIPHNIIVKAPEAGIDFKVELKNDYQTIRFTPTKVGKYTMYCDHRFLWFASHREKGMEGTIDVVE